MLPHVGQVSNRLWRGLLADHTWVVQKVCGHLRDGPPLPWRLVALGRLPSYKDALTGPRVQEDLHLEPSALHSSPANADP